MKQPESKTLLTVQQVAERFNLSVSSIYKLCQQRSVPYITVFGRIRFEPDAIETFLAEHTTPPAYGDA